MPLVRYVANKSSNDGTSRIVLGSQDSRERSLTLGGIPLDLTDDEVASLSGRFDLEVAVLAEKPVDEPEVESQDSDSVEPAHFGVDPEPSQKLPATPGASVSTPNTSTPSAGS